MKVFAVLAIAIVGSVWAQHGGYGGHHGGHGGFGGGYGGDEGHHDLGGYSHAAFELQGGHDGGHGHGHDDHYVDYHAHPVYHYDYSVHDLKHHDIKSQWETRDGDKVKGEYSLIEPDGTKRIVSYEADKHTGFNAVVKRVGHASHPIVEHDSHSHYGH